MGPLSKELSGLKQYGFRSSSDYKEFICGWGAAAINILVTFPLNKVIFRQVCVLVYVLMIVQTLLYSKKVSSQRL